IRSLPQSGQQVLGADLNRSELGRHGPVPFGGRDPAQCLIQHSAASGPAFTRVFPKNRCERAASEISAGTKKFFCKSVFHTKATPLWDRTIFGQVFVRGGMTKFSK